MQKSEKSLRQRAIVNIITHYAIESQEEILRMLYEQGFELTQATLSRDFRELRIAKVPDSEGNYLYKLPKETSAPIILSEKDGVISSFTRKGVVKFEFLGQFIVIKTPAGFASGFAREIDENRIPGVAATIAGHDTILIILRERCDKSLITSNLKALFSFNQ